MSDEPNTSDAVERQPQIEKKPKQSSGEKSRASTPKTPKVRDKKDCQAVRDDVRNYIRNERDTDLRKIMALNETLKLEDRRRSDFLVREIKKKTREIPSAIQKLIKSLKQACKSKIVAKGGSPHGLIRQAFVYWDSSKNGMLSADLLQRCVASIGVRLSSSDVDEVMQFYSSGENVMAYHQLLEDVLRDEPALTAIPTVRKATEVVIEDPRLIDPIVRTMPQEVALFVEAVRAAVANQMRDRGGTIESLLRNAFLMSDMNYSNGLDEEELIGCMKGRLGLTISPQQAREVMRFYDNKNVGEIDYRLISRDVTAGHPQFIHHPLLSARTVQASYKALSKNPYIPKPFRPVPNRAVEKFKYRLRESLETRIKAKGGSIRSWVSETFVKYDPKLTGFISDWTSLQGAMRRLNVPMTEDEAKTVMRCYENSEGKIEYHTIVRDIVEGEGDIIESGMEAIKMASTTPTSRAPQAVTACVGKIRAAVNPFGRQSKGEVNPRDVLHGTFLRFDKGTSGRLNLSEVRQALSELRVSVSEADVTALIAWYDTNGSGKLDYADLIHQIFGADPYLRLMSKSSTHVTLPKIKTEPSSLSSSMSSPMLSSNINALTTPAKDKFLKETRQQKEARAAFIRSQIINEKALLQQKLLAVEKQRKALMDRGTS